MTLDSRKILGILLGIFLTVPGFAQGVQNTVFVDAGMTIMGLLGGGLGIGGGYERRITRHLSLLGNFDYLEMPYDTSSGTEKIKIIGGSLHSRVYPLGTALTGWLVGLGAGYSYGFSPALDDNIGVPYISARTGLKWILGKTSGFVLEPALGYNMVLLGESASNSVKSAMKNNFFIAMGLGWAF